MEINSILDLLKNKNCRITPQRIAILEILCAHQSELINVERLLSLSQKLNKEINATTVYRNLELLDSMNLLYKLTNIHNVTHYKLICSEHHHHHLICTTCGKMEAIDYCPILPSLEALVKAHDFILTDHNLELFGLCSACSLNSKIPSNA